MPERKGVCVCKKCGYVLHKKAAVIPGWDAEQSSTDVHCSRCGKTLVGCFQENEDSLELDRIDKVLLLLPFLPLTDRVPTLASLTFGGEENEFLAR